MAANKMISFSYGAFADSLESQANKQGYTLGDRSERWQSVHDALVKLHIFQIATDGETKKMLNRFQKEMGKDLKPIEKVEG